uniref:NADH-ubiquinone oxidoreductase chain 5 n=1 Tax=Lachesilla sp. LaspMLY TaxID=2597020 RepID=A0A8K1ZG07_9NEOP|nr:NADH dehydrogenase subunit 5 [Lachesilla sp. LaspMLY]
MKMNCNIVFSWFLFLYSMISFFFFILFCLYKKSFMLDFEIMGLNSSFIYFCVLVDWMSLLFMSFVTMISYVVLYYSSSYMSNDSNKSMFIILVFSFVISMMLLIISPNLISLLLGWDGLGLISYCLVIYYQNIKSYNAGMLTVMTNRIGDVMILLGIAWMLNFGSWNFINYYCEKDLYWIISMLIIVASLTKSAQLPFSSWLPAAMAAPTPVSALVHSSTLVTAGVYLLIRFSPIYLGYKFNEILLLLSVLTMFMSGMGAMFEYDLKKIIALSTLSQLGLMISALSMGLCEFAFFHLLTHALFKSLLFMCAGYIIHGMNDSQDIRFMGGVMKQSPMLSMYFNVSNLALCGMPFLSGFFSKDLILESVLLGEVNLVILYLYIISIFFTVVYSFRLIYYSMVDELKVNGFLSLNDNDFIMLKVMGLMMFIVVIGGCLISWMIFIDFLGVSMPLNMKVLVLEVCFLGVIKGLLIAMFKNFKLNLNFIYIKYILGSMWFLPYLSTYGLVFLSLEVGGIYNKKIDLGWAEFLGGQGLYKCLIYFSLNFGYMQMKNMFLLMYMYMLMLILLWILLY